MSIPWYFLIPGGLLLLILGAELLVRGASRLAATFGVSPLIIGLTVVSVGTSSPEVAIAVRAARTGQADIALGNVIGSNIFNILVLLGLCAILVTLIVAQRLVRVDIPIMIVLSLAVVVMALDGRLSRLDGFLLLAAGFLYTGFVIHQARNEEAAVEAEYEAEFGGAENQAPVTTLGHGVLVLLGLAALILGARWLVDGATIFARALGISEVVIGLTIVAIGTSMPEVATSLAAVLRGERDIAVGNAIGSNLFNLGLVLGLTAIVAPAGVAVPPGVLDFDLPIMVAVAIAAMPIAFTGLRIARWEGVLFLAYYAAYLVYLLLDASQHETAPHLRGALLWFVIPLTLLTLVVLALHERRLHILSKP